MKNPYSWENNLDFPRKSIRVTAVNTEKHKEDWLSEKIGHAILPAQKNNSDPDTFPNDGELIPAINRMAEHNAFSKFTAERFYVTLNDKSQLDTLEVKAKESPEMRGY